MLKTLTGGMVVQGGYYWNRTDWTLEMIEHRDALPGGAAARFVRVPTVAMFALAPILGGLFVVFLPFIGLGFMLAAFFAKLRETQA